MFSRMNISNNEARITNRKRFEESNRIDNDMIIEVMKFSFDMSFGNLGQHRSHRTGGLHRRRNGEIFANAFQGKLAEFILYSYLKGFNSDFEVSMPDLAVYGLGSWDDVDIIVNSHKINVKSTKSFGNLLLLEKNDWNSEGQYIPNIHSNQSDYDFLVMIRISPSLETLLKQNKLYYCDSCDIETLKEILISQDWYFDIPGYVSQLDLKYIIQNEFVIKQGMVLNGTTTMDADNYYIQAGDLRNIDSLMEYLEGCLQ